MLRSAVISAACLLPVLSIGADFGKDFAVVMITRETEAKHGQFPLNRELLAEAVIQATNAGAKGVVLKFFLDLPKTATGDQKLASAIGQIPTLLQARIDDTEKSPNPLEDRFTFGHASSSTLPAGTNGWIPIPELSKQAKNICFVDFDSSPIPLVESYRGKTVKTLIACAAEMALGDEIAIKTNDVVSIGKYTARLNPQNRVAVSVEQVAPVPSVDFNSLLAGTLPENTLRDKVVIIGYDGAKAPQNKSPLGPMGVHQLFVLLLRGFYEALH